MSVSILNEHLEKVMDCSKKLSTELKHLSNTVKTLTSTGDFSSVDPSIICLTIFILACFVGYYVVWKVTPALHSPLMSVTNAISSVIIIGALTAAGSSVEISNTFGFLAIVLASINIFGGFVVTQRMLSMFSKNKK